MNYNLNYVYQRNIEPLKDYINKEHFSTLELNVPEYLDAIVSPSFESGRGGVYYNGESLEDSITHRGANNKTYPPFDDKNIPYEDKEVVYIGMLFHIWGHCLTDNLKHLWFILNSKYEELKKLEFVYVCVSKKNELPQNYFDLLERLGIQKKQVRKIAAPTRFKKVYLPNQCFFYNLNTKKREYTKEYIEILKKATDGIIENKCSQKLYFTRSRIKSFKDIGEKRIEKVFRNLGYTIVSPETLSLEQQISILKGCSKFAGTEGSVVHNCVFLPEGSELNIIRKADYYNGYQTALNELRNLNVTYIDAHKSIMAPKKLEFFGPFFLYVSRQLADFAGIRKPLFPVFDFLIYISTAFSYNMAKKILKKPYKLIKKFMHR